MLRTTLLMKSLPLCFVLLIYLALPFTQSLSAAGSSTPSGSADREYSVAVLTRIAEPVLSALSKGELKKQMPVHAWEREEVNRSSTLPFSRRVYCARLSSGMP